MPNLLRRLRRLVVELLLWAAALGGLAAIVLVICAHAFGLSLILFRTGSMEPTIPQGAASLVQEIPASEVAVGDVVTVDRAGRLPVTHRVTSVEAGEEPQERIITMQGDANAAEDPEPYTVAEVREVLWSVPGMAEPIHRLSDPWVMGTVTIGAALLVGWAFWPHRAAGESDEGHGDGEVSEDAASTTAGPGAAPARPRHAAAPPTAAALLIAAAGLAGSTATADRAAASTTHPTAQTADVEIIAGEHLRLVSALRSEAARHLSPGDTVAWELGVSADTPESGEVRTGLSSSGRAALDVLVESCTRPWGGTPQVVEQVDSSREHTDDEACSADRRVLLDDETLAPDGEVTWFGGHPADEDRWLRLQVALTDDAAQDSDGGTSRLRVHAEGQGDGLEASPGDDSTDAAPGDDGSEDAAETPQADGDDDQLATTGAPLLVLAAAALLSMGLGRLMMTLRAGRRRHL